MPDTHIEIGDHGFLEKIMQLIEENSETLKCLVIQELLDMTKMNRHEIGKPTERMRLYKTEGASISRRV